ncbi:unnamed protein product [Ostreobium quekettii]|uniref:Uncharacterized protein n=1 Tax=Ostreobium quekettii TaxID=121088 RepID=A0A8S1JEU7_9CHLO|nr:unnamed protein product [Ostreobium quekettii]
MARMSTSEGGPLEAEGPPRIRASPVESVLGCFKLPSCYNCSRVDLELRARYPWVADSDKSGIESVDDAIFRASDTAGPATPSVNSLGSGSLSSAAQVMPKLLGPEDWPVRQPAFPWEGFPPALIFDEGTPVRTAPPVLDLSGASEIEECPSTPPIADAPPAAPSPTNGAAPSPSPRAMRQPRAIRTGRTWIESTESSAGACRVGGSTRARGDEPSVRDGAARRDHKGGSRSTEGGSGRQMIKGASQTVELGPVLPDGDRFDPLYGADRRAPLPAKSVKLFVKHDHKPTWPHPAPPSEASALYMTRRKNKHPNLQVQIQAQGPSRWVSEVRRAEKNIRRTLAIEAGGEDAGRQSRDRDRTGRDAERATEAAAGAARPRGRKCESLDVRRTCDVIDSSKSLHTLLAAMDIAKAVASSRCSTACAALGAVQIPGARGQRPNEGPRREFDLARVLQARPPGPRAPAPFPQAQERLSC